MTRIFNGMFEVPPLLDLPLPELPAAVHNIGGVVRDEQLQAHLVIGLADGICAADRRIAEYISPFYSPAVADRLNAIRTGRPLADLIAHIQALPETDLSDMEREIVRHQIASLEALSRTLRALKRTVLMDLDLRDAD